MKALIRERRAGPGYMQCPTARSRPIVGSVFPWPVNIVGTGMSFFVASAVPLINRKIRCCGGSPCRNCTRSQRECGYAPVPEEVNRATREKQAIAKAARTSHYVSPVCTYSPYYAETTVFDVPYTPTASRPNMGHRRSVSVPNFEAQKWADPPTPAMNSPAIFETSQWSYPGYTTGPPIPQTATYPSVLEQPHPGYQTYEPLPMPQPPYLSQHPSTPPDSRSSSTDNEVMWSTPNLHLRVPVLTPGSSRAPHTPLSPVYYSPHPTPPLYQFGAYPSVAHPASTSPTLAPEMQLPQKELVGLGIHDPTYVEDYSRRY